MAGHNPWAPGAGPENLDLSMSIGSVDESWTRVEAERTPFEDSESVVDTSNREPPYGIRWTWSDEHSDFIAYGREGELLEYKVLQKSGRGDPSSRLSGPPRDVGPAPWMGPLPAGQYQGRPPDSVPPGVFSPQSRGRPVKAYQQPLDPKFNTVEKPKRFFSIGRIFKTIWFETEGAAASSSNPSGGGGGTAAPPPGRTDLEYTTACPAFYGTRPYAKFRWFVVVRKRLHHSLCFSITTFGGKGATKTSRGRPQDFVVLHAASVPAPAPDPDEKITRAPIGVIIEDEEQFISPLARLDCGRIYTVEDNLKVMKVGRVHPEFLPDLEKYFRESVS